MLYHHIIKLQSLKEELSNVVFLLHFKVTVRIVSANQTDCDLKFDLFIEYMNITSVILKSTFWMRIDYSLIFIEGISPVQQSLIEVQSFKVWVVK